MPDLIQLDSAPVQAVLKTLLQDKSTKKNILWNTNSYVSLGYGYAPSQEISCCLLMGLNRDLIKPRSMKNQEQQHARTKSHAEVFTPAWVCNKMINYCDTEWFGRENVFNFEYEDGRRWTVNEEKIAFADEKGWKRYVDSRRLEITCGEAPFLVSRYDSATGEPIALHDRMGMLDRKLRVVNENTDSEADWMKWCFRAFEGSYGYEYQGDNLLIARINMLLTFVEYLEDRWHREPSKEELQAIARRITWNVWQMDGLTGLVPNDGREARIFNWRSNGSFAYNDIKRRAA